jgi:DNA sulfur modification protein DndC
VRKNSLKGFITKEEIDLSAPKDDKLLIVLSPGRYAQLGLGPFTMEARKSILKELLELQKKIKNPNNPKYEVITEEELKEIRKIWRENGEMEDSVPNLYREIIGKDLDWNFDDQPLFDNDQLSDLEDLCQKLNIDFKLIKKLITLEKNYAGYTIRRGIGNELVKLLRQDYLHL